MIRLVFKHPDMPPALNGKNGLIRMHWAKRKELKNKFKWLIKEQKFPKIHGKAEVEMVNYYNQGMDYDNLASRFKLVGDALVSSELITDDSPEYIIGFTMRQVRVKTKAEVRLEIIFNSL